MLVGLPYGYSLVDRSFACWWLRSKFSPLKEGWRRPTSLAMLSQLACTASYSVQLDPCTAMLLFTQHSKLSLFAVQCLRIVPSGAGPSLAPTTTAALSR